MFLGFRPNFFGSFSKSFFNSPFILDLKPSMMISKQKREGFPWIYLDLFGDSNVRSLSKLRLLLVNFETENKSVFWSSSSSNCDLASISPFFSLLRTVIVQFPWNCAGIAVFNSMMMIPSNLWELRNKNTSILNCFHCAIVEFELSVMNFVDFWLWIDEFEKLCGDDWFGLRWF